MVLNSESVIVLSSLGPEGEAGRWWALTLSRVTHDARGREPQLMGRLFPAVAHMVR